MRDAGSAAATTTDRCNVAPQNPHESRMILFCLLCVSLVLGGWAVRREVRAGSRPSGCISSESVSASSPSRDASFRPRRRPRRAPCPLPPPRWRPGPGRNGRDAARARDSVLAPRPVSAAASRRAAVTVEVADSAFLSDHPPAPTAPGRAFLLAPFAVPVARPSAAPRQGVGCMDPLYYLIGCLAALAGAGRRVVRRPAAGQIPAPGRPRPRRRDHRRRPRRRRKNP